MRNKISTLFLFLKRRKKYLSGFLLLGMMLLILTGCSRAEMNAQIAESIGTLGMYENNEPVETPKMRSEREMQETKNAIENDLVGHLELAARYAASYSYDKALNEIALIDENYQDDERVISAKIEYQRLQNQMVLYNSNIAHFSVKTLIADPSLAFDQDDMSYYYNNWNLTVDEFKKILESLYKNNYVLMDIYDTVVEITNEDGTISFALNHPVVPQGKTPIILSFTEANYYSYGDDDGFSTKMVLDENGEIQNEYTDASGEKHVGAYDVVPILNEFVEEHPDFSLRGAKGIISVTGSEGVFGYGIETGASTIKEIAQTLRTDGWRIACHSYSNEQYESVLDYDKMAQDLDEWEEKVGTLVYTQAEEKEKTSEPESEAVQLEKTVSEDSEEEEQNIEDRAKLFIYPYGDEVSPGTMKHKWLLDAGYKFFFSLWATSDYLEVNSDYVRQSRRTLDGYGLHFYGESMEEFFDAESILDPSRPSFE